MVFNLVRANLTAPSVRIKPSVSLNQVTALPNIATNIKNAVTGINGGYFWRVGESPPSDHFFSFND
jgi:hypothetical protein